MQLETHNKKGERQQYFEDDAAVGLQELVARERMDTGAGASADALFHRFAGHNQKLDDEFDMGM